MSGGHLLVHLTDTHLLADPTARLFGFDPDAHLRRVLTHIAALPIEPAAYIVSGDLTNDGSTAAYARLAEALTALTRPGTPVLLGLGNHDERSAFRQMFGEWLDGVAPDADGRLYYSRWIGDLRIVMLDSLAPGQVWGDLGSAQLDWLARELDRPAPGGDLIVVHHPVTSPGVPWLDDLLLVDAAALAEVVRGRPLLGILAGHCHVGSAAPFAGTLASTAPAVIFQFDHYPGPAGKVLPGLGFSLCTIGRHGLIVNPILLPP